MAYLITHSLLSSWKYAMADNPFEDATSERDAVEEFKATLRREPHPTTDAMQNGIDFETEIEALAKGTFEDEPKFSITPRIAEIVRGGVFQYSANKKIDVAGEEFILHGRIDCLKAGEIFDFKYSKSYDRGKYFDSTQHPAYLNLIPEAECFTYLVSDGTNLWRETYRAGEILPIESVIEDFACWLNATGYIDLYREHWKAK